MRSGARTRRPTRWRARPTYAKEGAKLLTQSSDETTRRRGHVEFVSTCSLSFAVRRTTNVRRASQQRSAQWRRYLRAMTLRGDWSCAARKSSGETSSAAGVCRDGTRDGLDEVSSVAQGPSAAKRVPATSTMLSKAPGSTAAGRARRNARHAASRLARRIQRRDGRLTAISVVRQPASPISGASDQFLTRRRVGVENRVRVASRGVLHPERPVRTFRPK